MSDAESEREPPNEDEDLETCHWSMYRTYLNATLLSNTNELLEKFEHWREVGVSSTVKEQLEQESQVAQVVCLRFFQQEKLSMVTKILRQIAEVDAGDVCRGIDMLIVLVKFNHNPSVFALTVGGLVHDVRKYADVQFPVDVVQRLGDPHFICDSARPVSASKFSVTTTYLDYQEPSFRKKMSEIVVRVNTKISLQELARGNVVEDERLVTRDSQEEGEASMNIDMTALRIRFEKSLSLIEAVTLLGRVVSLCKAPKKESLLFLSNFTCCSESLKTLRKSLCNSYPEFKGTLSFQPFSKEEDVGVTGGFKVKYRKLERTWTSLPSLSEIRDELNDPDDLPSKAKVWIKLKGEWKTRGKLSSCLEGPFRETSGRTLFSKLRNFYVVQRSFFRDLHIAFIEFLKKRDFLSVAKDRSWNDACLGRPYTGSHTVFKTELNLSQELILLLEAGGFIREDPFNRLRWEVIKDATESDLKNLKAKSIHKDTKKLLWPKHKRPEASFNRSFLGQDGWILGDEVLLSGGENFGKGVELFDLLCFKVPDCLFLYHVKIGFDGSSRVLVSQAEHSKQVVESLALEGLRDSFKAFFAGLCNAQIGGKSRVPNDMTEDQFCDLFLKRKVFFVVVLLSESDRSFSSEISRLQDGSLTSSKTVLRSDIFRLEMLRLQDQFSDGNFFVQCVGNSEPQLFDLSNLASEGVVVPVAWVNAQPDQTCQKQNRLIECIFGRMQNGVFSKRKSPAAKFFREKCAKHLYDKGIETSGLSSNHLQDLADVIGTPIQLCLFSNDIVIGSQTFYSHAGLRVEDLAKYVEEPKIILVRRGNHWLRYVHSEWSESRTVTDDLSDSVMEIQKQSLQMLEGLNVSLGSEAKGGVIAFAGEWKRGHFAVSLRFHDKHLIVVHRKKGHAMEEDFPNGQWVEIKREGSLNGPCLWLQVASMLAKKQAGAEAFLLQLSEESKLGDDWRLERHSARRISRCFVIEGEWVDDIFIDSAIRKICEQEGNELEFVSPYELAVDEVLLDRSKKYLIPIWNGDAAHPSTVSHWSLLVFNPEQGDLPAELIHFDSCSNLNAEAAERFRDAYCSDILEVSLGDARQQRNGSDCGIHVVLNARKIAGIDEETADVIDSTRQEYANLYLPEDE